MSDTEEIELECVVCGAPPVAQCLVCDEWVCRADECADYCKICKGFYCYTCECEHIAN